MFKFAFEFCGLWYDLTWIFLLQSVWIEELKKQFSPVYAMPTCSKQTTIIVNTNILIAW